jgi:hypothetical protein
MMQTYATLDDAKAAKKTSFKLDPKHEGWCTPMTKKTCTGKRRQFALNAKKSHGFRKKAK